MKPYSEEDFRREVAAKRLSKAGETYFTQTLEADFARGRQQYADRLISRTAALAAQKDMTVEELVAALPVSPAMPSSEPDTPSPIPWRERQHQRELEHGWAAYSD